MFAANILKAGHQAPAFAVGEFAASGCDAGLAMGLFGFDPLERGDFLGQRERGACVDQARG
jgi:hypothetical protein